MSKERDVDGRCPACGSQSIHEAFCPVSWAEMADAYNKGRERYPDLYKKERTLPDLPPTEPRPKGNSYTR